MMREILFRGKRLDNGEWATGGSLVRNSNDGIEWEYYMGAGKAAEHEIDSHGNILSSRTLADCMFYKIDPDTVGQYTGLKDKDGKRIFEGDIVERDGLRMWVVWHRGFWQLWDYEENDDFLSNWCNEPYLRDRNSECCSVIGNIHENLELLKEGNA